MKKLLILLTSVYPTSTGDMFVHEELKYLATEFNKILIFPVNNTAKLQSRVPIDPPAELHLTNPRGTVAARLRDLLYLIAAFLKPSDACRYEAKHRAKGLKQRLYLYFAEGRARQVLNDTRPIIKKSLAEDDYAEIVVYSYWMSIPARAALLIEEELQQNEPKKLIRSYSRGHGYDIYDEASASGFQPFRRALIDCMDALFPCSQYGVDYMKSRFLSPGETSNIYLSRLAVTDPLVSRGKDWDDLLKLRTGRAARLHLVSCSRVIPLKRLDLLVDALALLKDKGLDLEWTHFGGGPGLEELQARAQANLSFMKCNIVGQVEHKSIMDFYCTEAADLFINVSASEGVPVAVMEALATGLPIAATDVGGTSEVVLEERGSVLWPADVSPEAIAETLIEFAATDTEERLIRAKQSRLTWAERSDSSTNYLQMSQIIAGHIEAQDIPFTKE